MIIEREESDYIDNESCSINEPDDIFSSYSRQVEREHAEPQVSFRGLAPAFLLLFSLFSFWAGYYMNTYSGDFSSYIYDESKLNLVSLNTGKPVVNIHEKGKKLFMQHCNLCHMENNPIFSMLYPPLRDSSYLQAKPERPISIVLKGIQGPFPYKGKTYNAVMASFESLSDQEIAWLLSYLRSDEWDNKAQTIHANQVKQVRKRLKNRKSAWTADELKAK